MLLCWKRRYGALFVQCSSNLEELLSQLDEECLDEQQSKIREQLNIDQNLSDWSVNRKSSTRHTLPMYSMNLNTN